MWRSDGWNMQEPAFRFVGAVGIILLFLAQGDEDLPAINSRVLARGASALRRATTPSLSACSNPPPPKM